jgi:hypothetical protein
MILDEFLADECSDPVPTPDLIQRKAYLTFLRVLASRPCEKVSVKFLFRINTTRHLLLSLLNSENL